MLIRREDHKNINLLTKGSQKKVWFTCDVCGIGVLQAYKNYVKQNNGKFCRPCRNKHTANRSDVKIKQSIASKKKWEDPEYKEKMSKVLKVACKKSWNNDDGTRMKIVKEGQMGENGNNWKGGYDKFVPLYDTYAHQIEWCEEVRRNEEDPNILEVRCFKCGKWFIPKSYSVYNRIQALKQTNKGNLGFYCSNECKNSCSIYNKNVKTLMREDAIRAGRSTWLEMGREVQPELRKIVLERDNYTCQKCGATEDIQCHHILPVATHPLESADVDNCITLCKECHDKIHKEVDGCGYGELETCIEYGKE